MGRETNIHSIRALDKQIAEGEGDIIKLKRARNSLLNISTRVPPEILGYIFAWSLAREAAHTLYSLSHFDGIRKGSYNFLLVCHHWFEVASRTPELWCFWGNTLKDWKKRYRRSGTAPLDLVLDGDRCDPGEPFDGTLQGAIADRVMQDAIRQVHLGSHDGDILTSIISSLTPDDEGGRNEKIESIILRSRGSPPVDVSKFFARSKLSKLRMLDLSGNLQILSWDHLASRTTLLTTLSLNITEFSPSISPTASQLFSILASNPNLRQLMLSDIALPPDDDGSTFQVPLRDLNILSLTGDFRRLFSLLRRLILPGALDSVFITGFDCTVEDVLQTLGPYIRNHFQRDARFQDRLGVCSFSSPGSISISVNAVCTHAIAPAPKPPFVAFTVVLADLPPDPPEQLFIDLVTIIPRDHVVSFNANAAHHAKPPEELFFMMPNIETLYLSEVEVSKGFLRPSPDGPHANEKLLPSLRYLHLEDVTLDDGGWDRLTEYLVHQTSDKQIVSLEVFGDSPYMPQEMVDEIKSLVEEFTYEQRPEAEGKESICSSCGLTHGEDE